MSQEVVAEEQKRRNRLILQGLLGLAGLLVAMSFNIFYTSYTNRINDERWCDLVVGLEARYKAIPPTSLEPDAAVFLGKVTKLRKELNCPLPTTAPSQVPSPARS